MPRNITGISLILIFFSCGSGMNDKAADASITMAEANAQCPSPQKITAIYKEYVYDLSGYESVSGNSAFNLFDENHLADPKNDNNTGKPETTPHPYQNTAMYFKNRGSDIVVDLRVPYTLNEVYVFDPASASDSVWIYTGNMQQWKLEAAFETKGVVAFSGWRKFAIGESTQFVMIRFKSAKANITEMVMYGCAAGTIPPPPQKEYTGKRLPAKTMREFIGVNSYQHIPLEFMKPFYYTRVYAYTGLLDDDTINPYPNNKYFLTPHGWYHTGIRDFATFSDSIVRFNKTKIWYSIFGVPVWMANKGFDNHDRPVTIIGMNTEDPMSYGRHANLFWNLAAAHGSTAVDTNLIQSKENIRFSGKNDMNLYENGNESDVYWLGNKYCNPMEYFALSSADYDGHEGKLGAKHGIKKADPNSELMMSGFVVPDTNRLRILNFLCNTLRSDKQFLWKGGIQYHHYSTNGKGKLPGDVWSSANAGITPEEDSLRQRLTRVRNATYKIQPDVECFLGEYGFDKSRKSKTSAPLLPGYNQQQSQGIMILRAINAVAFSGFDRFILYWIKDVENENHEAQFLTSGVLKQEPDQRHWAYPAWYHISTLVNHLGNYVPEKIVNEKGNVWVYKYRNKISPDSVAYFVYCPTRNGTKVDNFEMKFGKPSGSVTEVAFSDNSTTGIIANKNISNGAIRLNVSESPKLIFVKE